jgi:hypothetical protein
MSCIIISCHVWTHNCTFCRPRGNVICICVYLAAASREGATVSVILSFPDARTLKVSVHNFPGIHGALLQLAVSFLGGCRGALV